MSEGVAEHSATYRVRLFGDVDHQLDSLGGRPADAWTLQMLDALDPAALTDAQRLRALVLSQRAAAHAHAVGLRMAATMDSEEGEDDWAQDEIACALGVGLMTGSRVLTTARALSGRLHRTGELLHAGRISPRNADILAERTYLLDDDAARQVEAAVLPRAAEQTPTGFDNAVKAAVMTADPELAARKAKAAKTLADVRLRPAEDAMTQLVIDLPAPDGLAAFNLIDGLAGPGHPEDPRLAGERRVDAFIHLINARYDQGNLPTRHGRPIGVGVTLTLATAVGLADSPGWLRGYGPIPAPMAREEAAHGTWRAWVVDATTAHLHALGTESYRPDQALQDHVLARDGTCASATSPPTAATSTTSSRGPKARPIRTTPSPRADATTATSTADGGCAETPTALAPGPARSGSPTTSHLRPSRSTRSDRRSRAADPTPRLASAACDR